MDPLRTFSVRLPARLIKRIRRVANAQKRSKNNVILLAVERGLPAMEREASAIPETKVSSPS